MATVPIFQATIPLGSLILVTGASGLVASHVADQLLAAGYRVRGTVRNSRKNAWMTALFTRHGQGRFELLQIPDVSASGAWNEAIKGVSGVAHVLGALDMDPGDCDGAVEAELPWHLALLEAARNEAAVKSFVFTSSSWAALAPDPSKKLTVSEWTWNEASVELARSKAPAEDKGWAPYMALKTLLEQRMWEWVAQVNPPFRFNTVLLGTVLGYTLQPKHVGMPSTAGLVKWVHNGTNLPMLDSVKPQWYVDTRDAAMIYVAALTTPGVNGERLYAFGARFSW
jgi:nucleoside-diphosphate-sugar epimerase